MKPTVLYVEFPHRDPQSGKMGTVTVKAQAWKDDYGYVFVSAQQFANVAAQGKRPAWYTIDEEVLDFARQLGDASIVVTTAH